MNKKFNAAKEVKRNAELAKQLEELDPFAYQLVKNAKFPSIEKLNALLDKMVCALQDIKGSIEMLSADPETYNDEVVAGYAEVVDSFASRLGVAAKKQNGLNQ